jgi:hypothetical protein
MLLGAAGQPDRVWPFPATIASWGARTLLGARASSLLEDAAYDGAGFRAVSGWEPMVGQPEAARRTMAGIDD